MNTVFVKSGDYTPSIYFDTAGAVNDLLKSEYGQLIRSTSIFTLIRSGSNFSIIEGAEARSPAPVVSTFSFLDLLAPLNTHRVVFFGVVIKHDDPITTSIILSRAEPYVFNESERSFYSLKTNQKLAGNQIISLFYVFRMNSTNAYACVMNNLVTVDAFTVNGPSDGVFDEANGRIIFSDTGNSIRSKLINTEFSSNVVKMDYGHYLPTQTVCVKKGEPFTLKIFNKKFVNVDEDFIKGFQFEIETPLEYVKIADEFKFSTPSTAQTSFVSLKIKTNEFYDYITLGNSFERLALNFLVLVY